MIQSSGGQDAIQLATDATKTTVKGDLKIDGNDIYSSGDVSVLSLSDSNVTANKGLTIPATENFTFGGQTFTGSSLFQIKDSGGTAVLSGYLLTT